MATEFASFLDLSVLNHLSQPETVFVPDQIPTACPNPLPAQSETRDALTAAIKQECAEEVLPFTLMAMSQQAPPQQVTVRQSALHLRLMLLESRLDTDKLSELRQGYCAMAAQLETQRYQALCAATLSPWQQSGINSYYDYQHHLLMARVEQSVGLLESAYPKPTASSDTQPADTSALSLPNTPPASGPSPPLGYKKRGTQALNPVAVRIMSNWYERNQEHPYPSYETAEVMGKAGNISVEQVKKWFANRRRRQGNTKTLTQVAERRKRARVDSCEVLLPGGRD